MPRHEAMDAETVADLLSVSTRQVRNYVQAGMPSKREGRTPVFTWPEVIEWYVGYRAALDAGDRPSSDDEDEADEPSNEGGKSEDIRQANLRKTRAEANLKELQLSRLRGEVITIADAKLRLDRMLGNLRARLLGMAPKLASRLESEKARTGREAAIKDEMENLCREIATGAVVDLPPEPDTLAEIAATAALDFPEDVPEDGGISDDDFQINLLHLMNLYEAAQLLRIPPPKDPDAPLE